MHFADRRDQVGVRFDGDVGRDDGQAAGHAEVDDKAVAVVEGYDDFFTAAGEFVDASAGEGGGEVEIPGLHDIGAEMEDGVDAPAEEAWGDGGDDGLDFRKFGH